MLADSLSGFTNEVSVIHPSNDHIVAAILEAIGYDTTQSWSYEPSRHRDMAGKIAIGYMVVGEYSRKPEHRHMLDATDRIILAGMEDASLGRELAEMAGRRMSYKNPDEVDSTRKKSDDPRYYSEAKLLELGFTSGGDDEEKDPYEGEYLERDYEHNVRLIKTLRETLEFVRGKGN